MSTSFNPQQLKKQVREQASPAPGFNDSKNQAEAEKLELEARQQFLRLRKSWSNWLIAWICGLLIFQISLTVAVGLNSLHFEAYPYFLPLVVAQNFAQIVAMGLVIVKFLYAPN